MAVGQTVELNLTLQVGAVTQQVEVTGAAPLVQTTTSAVSEQVAATTIRELPLNGRDWAQLATLQPGISAVRNQSSVGTVAFGDVNRILRGFGNQLSVAGTRPTQNTYRIDAININDYTNGAPGGVLGDLTGVDAIQEFQVLTTNYSAEYGRTSGGVINAITRSGTNQFHGDVYEFLRNDALDAANFFDNFNSQPKAPFRRNQFGGAIGGPIKKDKTFFFFNYEGLRQTLDNTQTNTVPSANARNGIVNIVNPDGSITTCTIGIVSPGCPFTNSAGTVGVDPAVQPFLAFWPAPNGATLGAGDTALFSVVTAQVGTENYYSARVDHNISQKDTLAASFYYDHSQLTQPDSLNQVTALNSNARPFGSLEETHAFSPTLVNTARVGFNRNYAVSTTTNAINPLANDPSLGSVPGRPAPFISVPGIQTFDGGLGGFPHFHEGWNSFQFYDDVFWTRGAHSLKSGGVVERMQLNDRFNVSENGRFAFNDLPSFLTNQPLHYSVDFKHAERGFRQTLFGVYVQDDWRYKPNLTLNLGLRYEMTTNPTEIHNLFAFLRNFTDSQVTFGSPFTSNPTTANFEPRVGFAWDPKGKGKMAIRGGFGVFDVLPLPYYWVILGAGTAPGNVSASVGGPLLGAGSFPTQAYTIVSGIISPTSLVGQRTALVEHSPSRSYITEWNLNIQQEIAPSTTLSLGYVGSRGIHLPYRTDDSDIVMPCPPVGSCPNTQGYLWPTPVGSGTVINPSVGRIDFLQFGADSWYNGLQLGVTKRMTHGLQIQGAYTWGRTIDTGSSTIAGDQFSNSPSSLPLWFDPKTRRAVADFNLAQNLVINGIWNIPVPGSPSGLEGALANGWQLGAIFAASTGAPFPVVMAGDPLGMNSTDPWDFPNRLGGPGCGSQVNPGNPFYVKTQCFAPANPITLLGNSGRNPLTGPGLVNLDFSIFKNFPIKKISDTTSLQFRAEFFNILNRANFAPPIDNFALFNPDGSPIGGAGLIDATQTPPREIQFGLKFVW
jgi:outer membrane receptor protein involved in Fe transport